MSVDVHLEVAVHIDDNGKPFGVPWAPLESAFYHLDSETAYDHESSEWVEPTDEQSVAADEHLIKALAFPTRVIQIYREWTGPNGYDINIMSDIAALLVELGVPEDDPIIGGEWPEGEPDE